MAQVTLGLVQPVYFNGFNPFLNWWKVANFPVVRRTTQGNFTSISNASPAVFTKTGHGLAVDYPIRLTTTGSLPTGLTNSTVYFVKTVPDADTFTVSATVGGAEINTSSAGSGTHSMTSLDGKQIWDAAASIDYLDAATGELVAGNSDLSQLERNFYSDPTYQAQVTIGCDFSGEQWTLEWDGAATVAIGGSTSGSVGYGSTGTSPKTFTMGTNPGNTWVTFTATDTNNPPTNIRLYQTRYASNVTAGEIFNPDWLAEVRQFAGFRFMDWMATNNSEITNFSTLAGESYMAWGQSWRSVTNFGPKGGMPLSVMAALANETGLQIHVCIPHLATDAFVQSMAEYFRDNVPTKVIYEYTNEHWNGSASGGFTQANYCYAQGNTKFGGVGSFQPKWYGWRASQCMKIIRDVYNSRARWEGCLATQTVSTTVTNAAIDGFTTWKSEEASSLVLSDLFDDIYVTGYFGDTQGTWTPSAVTQANPPTVSVDSHGYSNGASVRLFVFSGMTEANNLSGTVANATANTFQISGLDTTAYTAWIQNDRNYVTRGEIFEIMDDSLTEHNANSVRYPTKYTHFNERLRDAFITGSDAATGYTVGVDIAALVATYWPAQKTVADTYGLGLKQYEGGCHLVGANGLTGNGGNTQYTEYLFYSGHSEEFSFAYDAALQGFKAIGGELPSKFLADGVSSQFGTWGGIRYWPTTGNSNTDDTGNPVWLAVRRANAGIRRIKIV